MISATEQVAVREWVKVPNVPGLYRNTVSGRYHEHAGEFKQRQGDATSNVRIVLGKIVR